MEHFLEQYGYLALFIGTFLEGETVLILAGFLAHRGYLQFQWVVAAAFAGSLFGDQLYFYLGRIFGKKLIARSVHLRVASEKIHRKLAKYENIFILSFRFIYGLRTASPIIIGTSKVSSIKYVVLNAASAAIWAISFSALGYFSGKAIELFLGEIKRYELRIIISIIIAGSIVFILMKLRERREISKQK
jgi:membrane protein DedA with SNARE-associated domain